MHLKNSIRIIWGSNRWTWHRWLLSTILQNKIHYRFSPWFASPILKWKGSGIQLMQTLFAPGKQSQYAEQASLVRMMNNRNKEDKEDKENCVFVPTTNQSAKTICIHAIDARNYTKKGLNWDRKPSPFRWAREKLGERWKTIYPWPLSLSLLTLPPLPYLQANTLLNTMATDSFWASVVV